MKAFSCSGVVVDRPGGHRSGINVLERGSVSVAGAAATRKRRRAESVKASAIAEVENIKAKWRDPDWLTDNRDKDYADQDDYQPGG